MIDLHIHTHASQDGQYPPRELFQLISRHPLRAIAFADHDSVDSVPEGIALSTEFNIRFVPAVELTTHREGHELHLLAYFIDPACPPLLDLIADTVRARDIQARKRCEKLRRLGYHLDDARVLALSGGKSPTGYPIYRAVIENPANRDLPAIQRYLTGDRSDSPSYNFARDHFTVGKPAHVPVPTIDTADAVRLVRSWPGVVPVLAHPGRTPFELLPPLLDAGLLGLEVYNPSHTPDQTAACLQVARRHRLLITAGSDYHGPRIKPNIHLARLPEAGYHLYEALCDMNARLLDVS